ncbi:MULTISPECIES: hypothetical protein [unclassified Aureimonas]|uniref:hypothetical protein n=1 Tax=unclassified Aureimonas TaxID=2615206 RepID=UPI00072252D5|nr:MULTISPECIES: hypothetical protein [unclassified Aureimonas]ALN75335.1 hypothetical protein M673_21605 [Aureimonas sp. AU20]
MLNIFGNLACLTLESNQVIGLRMQKLWFGGLPAWDESALMVCEKIRASEEAFLHLATGRSFGSVVTDYRRVVRSNIDRLQTPSQAATAD